MCGGFAMPIREGFAEKVFVITSGENMAIHEMCIRDRVIPVVKAAVDSAFMVGLPEARIPLAEDVYKRQGLRKA